LAKSTLPNLFDNHPPFQIDGNFGGAAAIAEMLCSPTPASSSAPGAAQGLGRRQLPRPARAGRFEVDVAWREGRLTRAAIRSNLGGTCRLRVAGAIRLHSGETPVAFTMAAGVAVFETVPGGRYTVTVE